MSIQSSSRVHSMLIHAGSIARFILLALAAPLTASAAAKVASGINPGSSQDAPTSTTFECIGSYNERVENFRQADAPDGHTYLFMRQGYTLRVLDASEPAHPAEIHKQRFTAEIDTLAVRWPILYVGCEDKTRVFDVTDPAHPQLRLSFAGGHNLSFDLMGRYLLVETNMDRNLEFTLYDVNDPGQPRECLSNERNIGYTNSDKVYFVTDGQRLFRPSRGEADDQGETRVAILDVTDSATTLSQRSIPEDEFVTFSVHQGQLVAGDTITTRTIPLTRVDPTSTVWVYNGDGLSTLQDGQPEKNHKMKITCEQTEHGLKICEKTGDTSPTLRCVYGEHAGAARFKLDGQRGYLLDEDEGLQILDLADPAQPRCLARYPLGMKEPVIRSVADGLVFVGGDELPGLRMINCADPTSPTLCGEYKGGAGPMSVQGHRAYIAAGESGLQILDITDPKSLQLLGRYPTPNPAVDLVTSGTLVYVLANDLLVVDITNPAKPVLAGSTPLGEGQTNDRDLAPRILKRLGPALYVVETGHGHKRDSLCQVVDVTNPTRPRLLPNPLVVEAESEDDDEKATASSVMPTTAPQRTTSAPSPYAGWFLGLPASYFMAHDFSSVSHQTLALFDLADPLHPHLACNYNALQSSNDDVTLRKGLIYHVDGPGGLVILRPVRQAR